MYTVFDASKDESLPYRDWHSNIMEDTTTTEKKELPVEVKEHYANLGSTSGRKQLQEKGKEYFSALGKKSAEKRKKDKRFDKKYYSALAQRAAASKRAKKEGKELPPFHMPVSPIHTINKFLKGEM